MRERQGAMEKERNFLRNNREKDRIKVKIRFRSSVPRARACVFVYGISRECNALQIDT